MIDTHLSNFFISELQASQISELRLTEFAGEKEVNNEVKHQNSEGQKR